MKFICSDKILFFTNAGGSLQPSGPCMATIVISVWMYISRFGKQVFCGSTMKPTNGIFMTLKLALPICVVFWRILQSSRCTGGSQGTNLAAQIELLVFWWRMGLSLLLRINVSEPRLFLPLLCQTGDICEREHAKESRQIFSRHYPTRRRLNGKKTN